MALMNRTKTGWLVLFIMDFHKFGMKVSYGFLNLTGRAVKMASNDAPTRNHHAGPSAFASAAGPAARADRPLMGTICGE